jgi:dienelactone hydrolase
MIAELTRRLRVEPPPLSFLNTSWNNYFDWHAAARAKLVDLLGYAAAPRPLEQTIEDSFEYNGTLIERVSYAQAFGPRTEGYFLKPIGADGALPCVVALHDHGGFKYWGKEKIVALPNEPAMLGKFKEKCYGGLSWASELVRRGFAVFAPDVFLWGSRKVSLDAIPEYASEAYRHHPAGSPESIEAYNAFTAAHENIVAKSLFLSGSTWAGVMVADDMRAVDYVTSRADVDAARVGCGGLSGGGTRSIFLSALDDRIACSFCAGFMSDFHSLANERIDRHTWMYHVPLLSRYMDLHDVYSLHAPKPILALYNIDDPLFTLEGQRASDSALSRIFAKANAADNYVGSFYPGAHKFDAQMQHDAFAFLEKWLL